MLHSHDSRLQTADGRRHLVNDTGIKKQSSGEEGQESETFMTMCCYGDVVLFSKNRPKDKIYLMKLFL